MLKASNILIFLQDKSKKNWLVNYNSKVFYELTLQLFEQLEKIKKLINQPKVILSEAEPFSFLACLLAAVAADCPIFLTNPNWSEKEFDEVNNLVAPNIIFTNRNFTLVNSSNHKQQFPSNLIMIPTGGTSGKIRFVSHTWETLTASVWGFADYFAMTRVNCFCTLPLYHVSGLMQFMRSFLTGGRILIWNCQDWREILTFIPNHSDYFISLVPTQLQFILDANPNYLSHFVTILLGGAPASSTLLETARKYHLPLAPTYGMTETASQIVTLKPEDFLKGKNSVGRVLPHAQVIIDQGEKGGIIKIRAKSLFLGYYPDLNQSQEFVTDDLGYFDSERYLYIVGRNSQKIISGGENIFPQEVEEAILATQLIRDVCVIALPDSYWGEIIAAVYVAKDKKITTEMIKNALAGKISRYKYPKVWLSLEKIPRNLQGKINYQEIKILLNTGFM